MAEAKSTKLSIREDRPTALASSAHGSNVDAIGFNLLFIARRNPKLAVEIMKLYAEARGVQEDDPEAPEEDFVLFAEEITRTLRSEPSD